MIIVLSGTKDGRIITALLRERGYEVVATTVTEYGKMLLQQDGDTNVLSGALESSGLERLIKEKDAELVVDATHPYAVRVSQMAMEVCQRLETAYIRYEREETAALRQGEGIIRVDTFKEAAHKALEHGDNVFLTVGSNHLEEFCRVIPLSRLTARVLPQSAVLKKCEEMGLRPDNLVALQGPFSKELNKELYKKYQAGVVVTKDSGKTGGAEEKIEAALELGLRVVMINRPVLDYPVVVRSVKQLLEQLNHRGK